MVTEEADVPVIVRLKPFADAVLPALLPAAMEEPLGVGRLNSKKSANWRVSKTKYQEEPSTLLKNIVMLSNTLKLYRFFSFNVILESACCCCTDRSVNETAVLMADEDILLPALAVLGVLVSAGVEDDDACPVDSNGMIGMEFLHKFVKNASLGVTRSNTPQTLVKF